MNSFEERLESIRTEMPIHIPTADGKGIAETIMVEVDALRDPRDGEIYMGGAALEELDRVKARHMGILLPSEIRELRNRLGMTQKEMGDLLGVAEKSYSRWETGRERLSHSLNTLVVALWEGRLSVADLQAMRQPAFPWLEHMGSGTCPCGTNHKPQVIPGSTESSEEIANEILTFAA